VIENILVACVGNICRSPMAEALLRQALQDMIDVSVSSAGLDALVDYLAAKREAFEERLLLIEQGVSDWVESIKAIKPQKTRTERRQLTKVEQEVEAS
jgi:hypothetical protein